MLIPFFFFFFFFWGLLADPSSVLWVEWEVEWKVILSAAVAVVGLACLEDHQVVPLDDDLVDLPTHTLINNKKHLQHQQRSHDHSLYRSKNYTKAVRNVLKSHVVDKMVVKKKKYWRLLTRQDGKRVQRLNSLERVMRMIMDKDKRLFSSVEEKPHSRVKREEDDVVVSLDVSLLEALTGSNTPTKQVEQLDGRKISVTVPKGVSRLSGWCFRGEDRVTDAKKKRFLRQQVIRPNQELESQVKVSQSPKCYP